MNRSLRIAIADDEPRMCEFYRKSLERLGHHVIAAATTGKQLLQQCQELDPELVITDIAMPDMDGLEAVAQLNRQRPLPVILVSAHHTDTFIDRARQNHVLAYLIKPITDTDLQPAIAIAMDRFQEFQTLRREADGLKQALEDRSQTVQEAAQQSLQAAESERPPAQQPTPRLIPGLRPKSSALTTSTRTPYPSHDDSAALAGTAGSGARSGSDAASCGLASSRRSSRARIAASLRSCRSAISATGTPSECSLRSCSSSCSVQR
jgi:two-component system, response regulator PdtaR